ncbi:MAG: hypothetical protein ACK45B_00140 [Limisphaerales bacterium]
MKTSTSLTTARRRAELAELLEGCPVGHDNPADCPLCRVRRLGRARRERWFAALNEEDLAYLATYHAICGRLRAAPSPGAMAPA